MKTIFIVHIYASHYRHINIAVNTQCGDTTALGLPLVVSSRSDVLSLIRHLG